MHGHAPPELTLIDAGLGAAMFLFLIYVIGAYLSMWTFFGVPVSMGRM